MLTSDFIAIVTEKRWLDAGKKRGDHKDTITVYIRIPSWQTVEHLVANI